MTGLGMMLNALGVKIDPQELEQKFNEVKELIPQFAQRGMSMLQSIDARLERIETALELREGQNNVARIDGTDRTD